MQRIPSILKNPETFLSSLKTHSNNFNQILSLAITSGFFTNPFVSSKLLHHSLSSPHISLSFSCALFFQIQNPNVFSWNFMFRALCLSSVPHKAICLYNEMRHNGPVPDKYTFPFVLKACGQLSVLEKGQEIHCFSEKLGFDLDVFVQNALVSMYSQCGVVQFAWRVFDMVPDSVRDVVTWNSMIFGYLQSDSCDKALKLFGRLLNNDFVKPNEVTVASAITGCARVGWLDLGRKVHSLSIVREFIVDIYVGSSLIDMYTKCGQLTIARRLFDRIPERNVVCWTSIISGYAQSGLFKEAIELFREMQVVGVKADSATVACVASACGHLGVLDQGRWVHTYCEKNSIEMNLKVKNALIDMYSKCGEVEKAFEIFKGLTDKDVFSWSSMISGLAMNEKSDKALNLFTEMEKSSDVKPNKVTFLGVLSACSHGGYVNEGFYYFKSMSQCYNLVPSIEHYGCMVDLLGRANLLAEAEKFIAQLPIKPDVVIWRSLLFACRSHRNLELAEFAANRIEELDPQMGGEHVLLSNIYASASRWHDVKRVRKGMAVQGIQKDPGCSFVEIDGNVHEFFVGDVFHDEIDRIYEMVKGINEDIRCNVSDQYILDYDQYWGG